MDKNKKKNIIFLVILALIAGAGYYIFKNDIDVMSYINRFISHEDSSNTTPDSTESPTTTESTYETSKVITITVTGEVYENASMKFNSGVSYRTICEKFLYNFNDFTKFDEDYSRRFYKSETITFDTYDTKVITGDSNDTILDDENISIMPDEDINTDISIDPNTSININEASIDRLQEIKGIGIKRATIIVEYRKTKRIETFEELKSILKIGDKALSDIKAQAVL